MANKSGSRVLPKESTFLFDDPPISNTKTNVSHKKHTMNIVSYRCGKIS
jgi:hypothetical protein